jgi:N-acetylmuramoyl-L-alanine amidase
MQCKWRSMDISWGHSRGDILSWIRRFTVQTGSAFVFLVLLVHAAAKAESASYSYHDQHLTFTHLSRAAGPLAVGIDDPGLHALLKEIGAVLTWRPGERYVLITTAQPQVVSFSVGDMAYEVGPVTAQASFAPFLQGTEVYLPFDELMRALYLAPERDGGEMVLQPQLASLDVRGSGLQAVIVAHGAGTLEPRMLSDGSDSVVYEFEGVGTTLSRTRAVNAGGIRSIDISEDGTVRDPKTIVSISIAPGTTHSKPASQNGDFEIAFGGSGGAPPLLAAAPEAQSTPQPTPQTQATTPEPEASPQAEPEPSAQASPNGPALVTGVTMQQTSDGATITIAVSGDATFGWHRLREPDNRFWLDVSGAQLQGPAIDQNGSNPPVLAMRVKQNGDGFVRVALSLAGQNVLSVSPSSNSITINVNNEQVADAPNQGSGSVGAVVSVNEPQALITPVPANMYGATNEQTDQNWKFAPRSGGFVAANPRLIVIDPGHGGSDPGSIYNGVDEKNLALDMALRLRQILVERGWQVRMTRTSDVDVYQANDTARAELQSRDDIANNAGARMFVSIHCNAYMNSGPSGTTTYYSKAIDVPLAQSIQGDIVQEAGTKDDGIVKSRLWVTLHAKMPAVLVETAFLSNPSDYAMLVSSSWREKLAEAIANGIVRYAKAYPVQSDPQ